jgi:DNA modification methylase
MSEYKLNLSDAVKWANEYEGDLFHCLLTDPPYHLTSITERFGNKDSAPAKFGSDGVFQRSSKGFMNQKWDGGNVAFQPETWEAFYKVLYPGSFGMSFASSRGWHRLAVAIEDAGFIIHPSIFGWVFGSGFPKATRTEKQERCKTCNGTGVIQVSVKRTDTLFEMDSFVDEVCPECNGISGEGIFDGHRYGLQALKPALEPIIVFQKPYEGSPRENIQETGAGILNIDDSRIEGPSWTWGTQTDIRGGGYGNKRPSDGDILAHNVKSNPSGRWPSNFYLDLETAKLLDKQSGTSKSKPNNNANPNPNHKNKVYGRGMGGTISADNQYSDEGGASRYFFKVQEQIDSNDPVFYTAKASRSEREKGLSDLQSKKFSMSGGGQKAIDRGEESYGNDRSVGYDKIHNIKNNHPTVKPLSLIRYLSTILLPPDEYKPRRLFVPFSGVASEMIGSLQAGWDFVEGVELTEEYIPIAEARLKYWIGKMKHKQTNMFE